MIVVTRYRVPESETETFRADLVAARDTLATRPGFLGGDLGRNVDDPELWTMVTRWENVGSYRRALSSYEVKLTAVPVLNRALEEPSAYESAEAGDHLNTGGARSLG